MPLGKKIEAGIFLLPGGYYQEGELYKEVELRPLTGQEEEIIAESSANENRAKLITSILINCVLRIGPIREITAEMIRNLLVVDRDYLILRLRQLTFGSKVEGITSCPECKQKIDIDFDLNDIEIEQKNGLKSTFLMKLSKRAAYKDKGAIHQEVEFRLPNGADQEEIAPWVGVNEAKALTELYARCIKRIGSIKEVTPNLIRSLSMLARREIEARMREIVPALDPKMEVKCPYCNSNFVNNFDIYAFFLMN